MSIACGFDNRLQLCSLAVIGIEITEIPLSAGLRINYLLTIIHFQKTSENHLFGLVIQGAMIRPPIPHDRHAPYCIF